MFHIELRQFPNVARSFNLSREELDARILSSWVAERPVELDDRRWSPEKATLKVYEGPRLRPEEIGMGRGWANVTRSGEEVTGRVLEEARAERAPDSRTGVEQLKLELAERAADQPLPIGEALGLASVARPGRRVSEQLALAEQSVWELLHQQRVRMVRGEREVPAEEWQSVLLAWRTWAGRAASDVVLVAVVEP
jgi:hypothetical protein